MPLAVISDFIDLILPFKKDFYARSINPRNMTLTISHAFLKSSFFECAQNLHKYSNYIESIELNSNNNIPLSQTGRHRKQFDLFRRWEASVFRCDEFGWKWTTDDIERVKLSV